MFIIWFGGLFGRLKGEFQQFNYVCIFLLHPLYIKSRKLVYGYIIIVYTIFFGCWIICCLYQLNCLQFSQLIVYIGFRSFVFLFLFLVILLFFQEIHAFFDSMIQYTFDLQFVFVVTMSFTQMSKFFGLIKTPFQIFRWNKV